MFLDSNCDTDFNRMTRQNCPRAVQGQKAYRKIKYFMAVLLLMVSCQAEGQKWTQREGNEEMKQEVELVEEY